MANVLCTSCGISYHETTSLFDDTKQFRGDMFKLKQLYRDNGWSSFSESPDTNSGDIECPGCWALYETSARIEEKRGPGRPRK